VESALAQTLAPLEILVCDDGSTDDTEQRVRRIADPRVRWVAGPRGGRPAIPRNRGIAAATGGWLAFLDSDDAWLPDKLARQFAVLRATGRRACSTNAQRVVPGVGEAGTLHRDGTTVLDLAQLLTDNRVVCSSALIEKSLLAQAEGFPEDERLRAIEDYALWLRVACFTPFDYLPEPLVLYRDDPPNSVRAFDPGGSEQRRIVLGDFLAWCRRHPGEPTRLAQRAGRRGLRRERIRAVVVPVRSRLIRGLASILRRGR
jgi:glycosyltransferase involved in cell wall biosynthesis